MNYIKLYIVNTDNKVLSLDKNMVVLPSAVIHKDASVIYQIDSLSQKVIKLGPSWIRYKIIHVTHNENGLDLVYGGLVPAKSPIIECHWLPLDNPNYYREIVNNYA